MRFEHMYRTKQSAISIRLHLHPSVEQQFVSTSLRLRLLHRFAIFDVDGNVTVLEIDFRVLVHLYVGRLAVLGVLAIFSGSPVNGAFADGVCADLKAGYWEDLFFFNLPQDLIRTFVMNQFNSHWPSHSQLPSCLPRTHNLLCWALSRGKVARRQIEPRFFPAKLKNHLYIFNFFSYILEHEHELFSDTDGFWHCDQLELTVYSHISSESRFQTDFTVIWSLDKRKNLFGIWSFAFWMREADGELSVVHSGDIRSRRALLAGHFNRNIDSSLHIEFIDYSSETAVFHGVRINFLAFIFIFLLFVFSDFESAEIYWNVQKIIEKKGLQIFLSSFQL